MNVLFLCSKNRLRSPTAEQLYSNSPGVEVRSAGLDHDAQVRVTPELLQWADWIFVMETRHRERLNTQFRRHLKGKRITRLAIADDYDFMQPELLALLERRLTPLIGKPR